MQVTGAPLIILNFAQAGTGPGLVLGLQGQVLKWPFVSPGTSPKGLHPVPVKFFFQLRDTANGSVLTAQIETSPDNSTWTAWGTPFTITNTSRLSGAHKCVGTINTVFVRVNVTAISGTAPVLNSYVNLEQFV